MMWDTWFRVRRKYTGRWRDSASMNVKNCRLPYLDGSEIGPNVSVLIYVPTA